MAFVLADRVLETSTSTGTGSFVLAGARDGYQSFTDALANGDTTYYTITDGTDWEVGLGTWTESTATLARTTILSSSNSGSAVNFGAGTKEVFISYPSGKFSEDGSRLDDNIIYNATNTNNVAGVWEATITDVTSYYDGLMVAFYPNKIDGVSSGTTFEINSLGAKTVTRPDTNETAITTHYDGTNLIFLRYVSADDYFIVHANYNTTHDYNVRWQNFVIANNIAGTGTAWHGYQLVIEGIDGKFYPVTEGGSSGNTNTVSTVELRVGGTILLYENSADVTAGNEATYVYESLRTTRMEYWNNRDSGWATDNKSVYLVATKNSNGNFVLDNTSYTSFLTQDLPTSDDGKYYIKIGWMNDTDDDFRLEINHPIYIYKNGAIREWGGYASNADQLDGNEASAFATSTQGATADSALQNVSEDTSPSLGGDLSLNGNNITGNGNIALDDDKYIAVGASNDFAAGYNDGFNFSYIDSASSLYLSSSNVMGFTKDFAPVSSTDWMAKFTPDGSCELYHDGQKKIETTSTGVDVTGEMQCDSIDVDGIIDLDATTTGAAIHATCFTSTVGTTTGPDLHLNRNTNDYSPGEKQGGGIYFGHKHQYAEFTATAIRSVRLSGSVPGYSSALLFENADNTSTAFVERMRMDTFGITINEDGDAGTDFRVESDSNQHMLFVDASANAIGINNSSPSSALDVTGDVAVSGSVIATGQRELLQEYTTAQAGTVGIIAPSSTDQTLYSAYEFEIEIMASSDFYGYMRFAYWNGSTLTNVSFATRGEQRVYRDNSTPFENSGAYTSLLVVGYPSSNWRIDAGDTAYFRATIPLPMGSVSTNEGVPVTMIGYLDHETTNGANVMVRSTNVTTDRWNDGSAGFNYDDVLGLSLYYTTGATWKGRIFGVRR